MENWSQITDLSHVLEVTEVSLQNLETMCSTFSFVLIHFKVICTLHEGGEMCLDA